MISKILQILCLQPRISKVFLDHQNNFSSQQVRTILVIKHHYLCTHVYKRTKGFRVGLMILRTFGGHDLTNNFVFRAKFKCFLAADFILFFRVLQVCGLSGYHCRVLEVGFIGRVCTLKKNPVYFFTQMKKDYSVDKVNSF